jgi:putative polyketide hydroxylase
MAAQDAFEAVLRRHVATYTEIDLRFNTELTAFDQDGCGVTATLCDRNSGMDYAVHASYLIAADGASSRIREMLGIKMLGPCELNHNINIHFRAELAPGCATGRPPVTFPPTAMAPYCGHTAQTDG